MILSYKFRLYPNGAQISALIEMLGAMCDLYNAALQQRREAWSRGRRSVGFVAQAMELKAVRAADERLAGYSFTAEQQLLRRVQKAYDAFFDRVKAYPEKLRAWRVAGADPKKRPKPPGLPRFRAKSRFDSAEFRVGDGLTLRKSGRLGIIGIPGEVKVKRHRDFPPGARIKAAVVSRSCGHWYVCFQIEAEPPATADRPFAPVGIDFGLSALLTLSTGDKITTPQWIKETEAKRRRLNRALARKTKTRSNRRAKARMRLARHERRVANRRRDHHHKLARALVDRFTHIAMEDLGIEGLARGMLAKPVHNAAWGTITGFIRSKAEWAGGVARLVDPRGTTIECSACGERVPKALSERVHSCLRCGLVADRDVNAAINVENRAGFGPGHGLQAPTEPVAA